MAGVNENYYTLPDGVAVYRTDTVIDLYMLYPDLDSFYSYYGPLTPTTINNIKNEFNIDKSIDINIYVGGEKAPVSGTSLFQKTINYPAITSGDSALDAAEAAAIVGLTNGYNALVNGSGDIYSLVSTLVDGGAGYELAGLLAIDVEAAICALVAYMGYKIGSNVYSELDQHQWFKDLIDLGADWVANDDSKLANLYRKVLGVQYGNQTYLDSRFYNAVSQYLKNILPSYKYTVDGYDFQIEDFLVYDSPTPANPIYGYQIRSGEKIYRRLCGNGLATIIAGRNGVINGAFMTFIVASSINNPTFFLSTSSDGVNWGSWSQTTYVSTYTKDNKTVYYITVTSSGWSWDTVQEIYPYNVDSNSFPNNWLEEVAWSMVYGHEDAELPDGIEVAPWAVPSLPTNNQIHILVDLTQETTIPYYPVALPIGPYVYPSYPDNYTDITIIENPDDQILPYHIPAPVQPETNPTSDPDDNPSNPAPVIIPIVLPIGGGGSNGGQSPSIPIPTVFPPFFDGVSQYGGLYTVYAPTQQQLYDFGDFLWVKWTDASLPKIINNPFDGVISLHEIYATPGITGAKEITSGFLKSNVTAATVGTRYTEIDCGTVIVPENYQNYLDYSPYSKVYCFLPFIGLVQLNSDDIVGHAVNITYKVDSYSGACVAIITVAQSDGDEENYSVAMYQFEGNCAVQLPISGGSQASLTAGLWLAGSSAVGSIVNGVASTVSGNGVMDLLNGVSNAISDVSAALLTRKSDVQHSGNMSGNFGAMAGKKPYLIVKFPRQVPAPNYNMDYGYPAHRRVTIGQCNGYLRVREVNIISATATDEEKAKIEQLLKEGVYFE